MSDIDSLAALLAFGPIVSVTDSLTAIDLLSALATPNIKFLHVPCKGSRDHGERPASS